MIAADEIGDRRIPRATAWRLRAKRAVICGWATVMLSTVGLVRAPGRAEAADESPRTGDPGTVRIVHLDGQVSVGRLASIRDDGTLVGESLPRNLRWDDVWRLERDVTATTSALSDTVRSIQIETRNHARLQASEVSLEDDEIKVTWPLAAAPVSFAIDELHAMWFDRPDAVISRARSLAKPAADVDRVVVTAGEGGNQVQILPGLVTGCTAKSITLERDGRSYDVARRTVLAVVMAEPPGETRQAPAAMIRLSDGSRLPASSLTGDALHRADGTWTVKSIGSQPIRVASLSVLRIDARSPRLTLLSAQTPTDAVQKALIVEPLTWGRDRSVDGLALQVAGQTYDTGIGMQAGMRLTFAVTGDEPTFFATAGLNDRTGKRGDCNASVRGDGDAVLWSARLRGGDRPLAVRVPLRDNRQLTLVVEPGENLDLGDHVDWCEARLVTRR